MLGDKLPVDEWCATVHNVPASLIGLTRHRDDSSDTDRNCLMPNNLHA